MKAFKSKYVTEIFLMIFIIFIGAYLRFVKLSQIPGGLYVDEALVGYNAYSIFQTAGDEYGKFLPVLFRFFGSYSPPLYIYLTSLIVSVFDLSIFSTRLLSVLSGIVGILVIYLLSRKMKITKSLKHPLIAALVFAISPGMIFYSRLGYEVYFASIIYLIAIYLLWSAFEKPIYYLFALPAFILSIYSAHTEIYLVPFTLLLIVTVFRKKIFQKKARKYLKIGILISILLLIPLLTVVLTPAFFTKSGIFYPKVINDQAAKIFPFIPNFLAVSLAFLREFLSRFVSYLSPLSLFFLPDPDPQRSLPGLSFFYPWMVFPYLIGLYTIWQNRKKISVKYILVTSFAILFIGSLVRDPFSTQRILPFFFTVVLIISLGIEKILERISFWPRAVLIIFVFGFSMITFWRSYFVLLPKERAKVWGYGFSELAQEVVKYADEDFLIDQSRIKPAYIELVFFLKYSPAEFQKEVDQKIKDNYYQETEFSNTYLFGNIETRTLEWEKDIYKKQIIVGDELSVSEEQAKEHFLSQVFEIKDPLGFIIFKGFRTNPKKKCINTNYQSLYCKEI